MVMYTMICFYIEDYYFSIISNGRIFGIIQVILFHSYYPEILQAFSSLVSKETHQGTVDNTLGAIAKMMIINYNGIPLDQVSTINFGRNR